MLGQHNETSNNVLPFLEFLFKLGRQKTTSIKITSEGHECSEGMKP